MIFRNSLTILIDNFGKVYKLLLYRVIVMVIIGSFCLAIVIPNLAGITASDEFVALRELMIDFAQAIISGDSVFLSGFREAFESASSALFAMISSRRVALVFSVLGILLLYLIYRFFLGLGNFVMGDMINNKLSCYADTTFFSGLVKDLGAAAKYFALYVPLSFAFDLVLVLVCYLVFFLMLSFLPVLVAIFLSMTLIIVAQAVKMTYTSNLMPAMIEDRVPIKEAVRESFLLSKSDTLKLMTTYVALLYLLVVVNVVATICTFGSAMLITMPASYTLLICVQFVFYYTSRGKKYFINYNTIVSNVDRGEKEKFFGDNEMYEKTKFE